MGVFEEFSLFVQQRKLHLKKNLGQYAEVEIANWLELIKYTGNHYVFLYYMDTSLISRAYKQNEGGIMSVFRFLNYSRKNENDRF